MRHISSRKTYAFTSQKIWFYPSKTMVSLPKNYGFASKKHSFFQQIFDFFVQGETVFIVINY